MASAVGKTLAGWAHDLAGTSVGKASRPPLRSGSTKRDTGSKAKGRPLQANLKRPWKA